MSPKHIADISRVAWRHENRGDHEGAAEAIAGSSTGERCAIALIISRPDLLPRGYSVLDAVQRVEDGGWPIGWLMEAQKLLRYGE